jgi:hypothetical protein
MGSKRTRHLFFFAVLALMAAVAGLALAADRKVKSPTVEDVGDGSRRLLLPDDISTFLQQEFSGSRLPSETDFSEEMRQYYNSRLIGVHPAVAFGDFNGDKKRDYLFLLITGDSKWGPLCELVAANGEKKGFTAFRLGEVYNFKEDYVSFQYDKLLKGRFKKGAWYINWSKKDNRYIVTKS